MATSTSSSGHLVACPRDEQTELHPALQLPANSSHNITMYSAPLKTTHYLITRCPTYLKESDQLWSIQVPVVDVRANLYSREAKFLLDKHHCTHTPFQLPEVTMYLDTALEFSHCQLWGLHRQCTKSNKSLGIFLHCSGQIVIQESTQI